VPSIDSTSARLPPLPCSDNLFARVKRFVFNRWSDLATQTWPTHPWLVGRLPLRFPAHAIRLWSFDPQPLPAPAQPDRRVHRGPEPRRTGRGAHVPPASARTGLPSGPGCAEFTFRVLAPSRPDGRCVLGARSIMPQPPAPAFRVVKTVAWTAGAEWPLPWRTPDDFFGDAPLARRLLDALAKEIAQLGGVGRRVGTRQVAIRRGQTVAVVGMPGTCLKLAAVPLALTLSLSSRDESPRWQQVIRGAPKRFTLSLRTASGGRHQRWGRGWVAFCLGSRRRSCPV